MKRIRFETTHDPEWIQRITKKAKSLGYSVPRLIERLTWPHLYTKKEKEKMEKESE